MLADLMELTATLIAILLAGVSIAHWVMLIMIVFDYRYVDHTLFTVITLVYIILLFAACGKLGKAILVAFLVDIAIVLIYKLGLFLLKKIFGR